MGFSINKSPNVFISGDLNAFNKDWLINSAGTDRKIGKKGGKQYRGLS